MGSVQNALREYRESMEGIQTIGDLVWFTIERAHVRPDQLAQWFLELELNEALLPKPIKPVDAFRKATGEARKTYTLSNGMTAELMIREVATDSEHVLRHVVRETKDSRGRRLSYEEVGEAVFYRAGKGGTHRDRFSFDGSKLSGEDEAAQVKEFLTGVSDRYQDLCEFLHSDAIRAVIRNYVLYLNAILCRPSGGVYFVHESRRETVLALEELVGRIGAGCTFHVTPLPDNSKQRDMLTQAYQDQVIREAESLLKDIATLNERSKGKKIPGVAYSALNTRLSELMESSEEYTRILGLAQGRAAGALETAITAIIEMSGRIGQ